MESKYFTAVMITLMAEGRVLLYAKSHRQDNTAFVTPVVEHWLERAIAQWVHDEGWIRRPIAPSAEALQRSYISLPTLMAGATSGAGCAHLSGTPDIVSITRILPQDSRFSQCSTTGVTKAVVCIILSVGWCI